MGTSLREQIVIAWRKLRGRPRDYSAAGASAWDELGPEGPPKHDALVPTGPPRRPLPSSSVALPLPEPENWDVDALGRPLP